MKSKFRLFIASVLLAISIVLLVRGYAPNPREVRIQKISPAETQLDENRRLTLEFPAQVRADGAGETVRLRLDQMAGGTTQSPDIYDTHNVTAEAEFDLAGMDVQPSGATFEPLKRGQSATFNWNITPRAAGTYRGTVWLHLDFEKRSTGEKSRVAISAQIIEIRVVDFFGMSSTLAQMGGLLGVVVSGALGYPFLYDLLNKLKNKN